MSVKDKIKEELNRTGRVDISDVGTFQRTQPASQPEQPDQTAAPIGAATDQDSTVPLDPATSTQPAEIVAATPSMSSSSKLSAKLPTMDPHGNEPPTVITVTAADKSRFLDSVVSGKRLQLPFATFNGRLTGVFQSRLNSESDAIVGELNRRIMTGDLVTDVEYGNAFRCSVLRFQLVRYSGVDIAPVEGPIVPVRKVVDGQTVIEEPSWFNEAMVLFADLPDALNSALYRQLLVFERKYWAMVRSADDQNFWNPEDSTLE